MTPGILALLLLSPTTPCLLRAQVEALRDAEGPARLQLRTKLTERSLKTKRPKTRACIQAVLGVDAQMHQETASATLTQALKDLPRAAPFLSLLIERESLPKRCKTFASKTYARLGALAKKAPSLAAEVRKSQRACALLSDDPKWLLKVLKKDDTPAALLGRARALEKNAQARARSLYITLLTEAPGSAEAMSIEANLDKYRLSLADRAKRIERLLAISRRQRAASEAIQVPRPKSQHKRQSAGHITLERVTVEALVRADQNQRALAHATALVKTPNAPEPWREIHAWALGKAGRELEASAAWARLNQASDDEALKSESCFMSGFLAYEVDAFDLAQKRWAACGIKQPARKADALWYTALIPLLQGQRALALQRLEALAELKTDGRRRRRHQYWLGRTLLSTSSRADKRRGRALLTKLSKRAPLTYYGLLARKRAQLPKLEGVRISERTLTSRPLKGRKPNEQKARLLFELGLDRWARALIRGSGRTELALAQTLGDWRHAIRYGFKVRPSPAIKQNRLRKSLGWRASYPEPWPKLVSAAAKKHGVEPSLVYAIMRTESFFDPEIVSRVGATGLLQLMPYSALGIAKALKQPPPSKRALTRPRVAIDLGTAILGSARREFGSKALAAAAYNGDPKNVADWLKRYGDLEIELFIERIPFKETRRYVKKVLAVEALYRGLKGEDISLDLPQGVFGAPPKVYTRFSTSADGG